MIYRFMSEIVNVYLDGVMCVLKEFWVAMLLESWEERLDVLIIASGLLCYRRSVTKYEPVDR